MSNDITTKAFTHQAGEYIFLHVFYPFYKFLMFFTCPPTLLTRHVSMLAKLGFKSMSFLDRTKIEARFPETDQVERLIFYSKLRGCLYIT